MQINDVMSPQLEQKCAEVLKEVNQPPASWLSSARGYLAEEFAKPKQNSAGKKIPNLSELKPSVLQPLVLKAAAAGMTLGKHVAILKFKTSAMLHVTTDGWKSLVAMVDGFELMGIYAVHQKDDFEPAHLVQTERGQEVVVKWKSKGLPIKSSDDCKAVLLSYREGSRTEIFVANKRDIDASEKSAKSPAIWKSDPEAMIRVVALRRFCETRGILERVQQQLRIDIRALESASDDAEADAADSVGAINEPEQRSAVVSDFSPAAADDETEGPADEVWSEQDDEV